VEPRFEDCARLVFAKAGIAVTEDDLALVALIDAGYEATVTALDDVDPERFPFEPIDPSGPPER
jgi:hypothetical protein